MFPINRHYHRESETSGIPRMAIPTSVEAPVHIDVGGVIYTTTLETLRKYPRSRLAMMFSGEIPIVVDELKQHYFIDRDGGMFRHILNFLRNECVLIPNNFKYFDLLLNEAQFFMLDDMVYQLLASKVQSSSLRLEFNSTINSETLENNEDYLI